MEPKRDYICKPLAGACALYNGRCNKRAVVTKTSQTEKPLHGASVNSLKPSPTSNQNLFDASLKSKQREFIGAFKSI